MGFLSFLGGSVLQIIGRILVFLGIIAILINNTNQTFVIRGIALVIVGFVLSNLGRFRKGRAIR